jgi:polysaccharide biosynthesis protein PslG
MSGARPAKAPMGDGSGGLTSPEAPAESTPIPSPARPQVSHLTRTRKSGNGASHPASVAAPGRSGDGAGDGLAVPGVAGLPPIQRQLPTPDEAARSFHARRRFLMWAGLVLLSVLLAVEIAILSPWTDPAAGRQPRRIGSIPLAEVHPYGVNVFLHKEVDAWKKEKTLDMARDMGAVWIKQQFPWAEIEFGNDIFWDSKNNQNAWEKFDTIVNLAEQRGIRVIARIDSTPEWARLDDDMPQAQKDALRSNPFFAKFPPSRGHLQDFGQFIRDFVKRYRGRVPAIQVWNEPNLKAEWATGVNAKEYVTLLQTAYIAAKSVDPNIIVLAAPLATNNELLPYAGNLNELDYLQAMYYAGAQPYFDAMSANAYGKEFPPEDPPSRDKLNFRRVELLRQVMEDNSDGGKAIWFNEYGWNASPEGCCQEYPWARVTLEQQAEYTARGIEYAREHWPWAGVFTIWYLRQVGDIPPTKSEYYFGLVNPDFAFGRGYRAVRDEAHAQNQVATPGEWGPLSPPVQAGPHWQARFSPAVPGGSYVAPSISAEEDNLDIAFQGTDVTLMLVPAGSTSTMTGTTVVKARYYVAVDGSSDEVARELPRDEHGRAYIDLPANGQATDVRVVSGLGAELPTGRHTLRISVSALEPDSQTLVGAGHVAAPLPVSQGLDLPGIGTVTVEARRSYLFFTVITLLLVAGVAVEAWALSKSKKSAL